ncbi:hypothetical protein EYV94_06115 [Puteibacter caeruleilacunae]|nr:hypothetical protein EYV94_06115 [Puteibacter caeruleilacunae]
MDSSKEVSHTGSVVKIEGRTVFVKIVNVSACASCHAKGACSAADTSEKIIEVSNVEQNVEIGQKVKLSCKETQGMKAILFGYIIPFFILLTVLIILTVMEQSEQTAGLGALLSLVPYYVGLFLFREKIKKSFSFRIEEIL